MRLPSVLRHPYLLSKMTRHPAVAFLGFREGRGDAGLTYDNDPGSDRSLAYDAGRDLRRWGR